MWIQNLTAQALSLSRYDILMIFEVVLKVLYFIEKKIFSKFEIVESLAG